MATTMNIPNRSSLVPPPSSSVPSDGGGDAAVKKGFLKSGKGFLGEGAPKPAKPSAYSKAELEKQSFNPELASSMLKMFSALDAAGETGTIRFLRFSW